MSYESDMSKAANVFFKKHIVFILMQNGLNYWQEIDDTVEFPLVLQEEILNYIKYSVWKITGKKKHFEILDDMHQRIMNKLQNEKASYWKACFVKNNRYINQYDIDDEKSMPDHVFSYDKYGDLLGDFNSIFFIAQKIQKEYVKLKLEAPKIKIQGFDHIQGAIHWRQGFISQE